jgi:hypothetical protein
MVATSLNCSRSLIGYVPLSLDSTKAPPPGRMDPVPKNPPESMQHQLRQRLNTDLPQQHSERGRTDVAAGDVCTYATIMMRGASADQLRSEGAAAVHDVPGRRQGITPTEAAERFFFR